MVEISSNAKAKKPVFIKGWFIVDRLFVSIDDYAQPSTGPESYYWGIAVLQTLQPLSLKIKTTIDLLAINLRKDCHLILTGGFFR